MRKSSKRQVKRLNKFNFCQDIHRNQEAAGDTGHGASDGRCLPSGEVRLPARGGRRTRSWNHSALEHFTR